MKRKFLSIILAMSLAILQIGNVASSATTPENPNTNIIECQKENATLLEESTIEIKNNSLNETQDSAGETPSENATEKNTGETPSENGEENNISENSSSQGGQLRAYADPSIISGAFYKIKNVDSGKYMNVHYGIDGNGTNVYQWTQDGSTEQIFKVVYDTVNECYKIRPKCSNGGNGRVLDICRQGSPLSAGQNIQIWDETDPTSQEFMLTNEVNLGGYRINPCAYPSLAVAAYGTSNGSGGGTTSTSAGNIYLAGYSNSSSQLWNFELAEHENATGYLEAANASGVIGWTWCRTAPNTPLDVHIYCNNITTGQSYLYACTANILRGDLLNAGYGNGCHGFNYVVDWTQIPNGTYEVYAYAIGLNGYNILLQDSPKTFVNTLYAISNNATGYLDAVTSTFISGWAWAPTQPNTSISVHIYIRKNTAQEEIVAAIPVSANIYRGDLQSAGYGNGCHGYKYNIDWSDYESGSYKVYVYAIGVDGVNPLLNNCPTSYNSTLYLSKRNEVDDAFVWWILDPVASPYIAYDIKSICTVKTTSYTDHYVTEATSFAYTQELPNPTDPIVNISIGTTKINNTLINMQNDTNVLVSPTWIWKSAIASPNIHVPKNSTFSSLIIAMVDGSLYPYRDIENVFTF